MTSRLYVESPLKDAGDRIALTVEQAHYLKNVMRLSVKDTVHIFNGHDGEWQASIVFEGKRDIVLKLVRQVKSQVPSSDVWLLASPIKKERFEWMIEKATELGIGRLVPVICERTVARRMNDSRAHVIAIEAAEQCERLDIPDIDSLRSLQDVLSTWPADRVLLFCHERAEAEAILPVVQRSESRKWAILIGPEGGFTPEEKSILCRFAFVIPVSLGSHILRAETAAIAALAILQTAIQGIKIKDLNFGAGSRT